MSNTPDNLKYAATHEWVLLEGDVVTVGITDHAQDALGDLVYVELPNIGEDVAQGDEAGVVESVKAASDIYAPVSGEVIEVNEALADNPEIVNSEPYDGGWLYKIRITDASELDALMSADEYAAQAH